MNIMIDTIAAIATPPGRGGVGIVRISGPKAFLIAQRITHIELLPRQAHFAKFYDQNNLLLDEGVAIFFAGPHSFTGEDVVELQGHGSPIVLDLILAAILQQGARLARPGEFSERAFLNDKIDLLQAEAIADLIDAASIGAARSALRSLQGDFSKLIHALVVQLIYLRTFIEATLDFPEEDVEFVENAKVIEQLMQILSQLERVIESAKQGVILKEGLTLLILGKPNAGKSSLLNALAQNDVAIVSEHPGTTRDLIKESISVKGVPVHIVDTAGLRDHADVIEAEGMKRALAMLQKTDLVLWVIDALDVKNIDDKYIAAELKKFFQGMESVVQALPFIIVVNKIDLVKTQAHFSQVKLHFNSEEKVVSLVQLSAKYAEGLAYLEDAILKNVSMGNDCEHSFIARRRHLEALQQAFGFLQKGLMHYQVQHALELLAEDCRLAQVSLGAITGEFRSDDLLGSIFSTFCIGK
jgi:tRNA modification GTPase